MRATSVLSASSRLGGLFLLLTACCLPLTAQIKDFTRWVDPFIGTGGHGHTFPGAVMPFGMVQLSPDTRTDNWDGSSGYHYSDDIIYGFSHTHLSGTGIPDGCDILFMPTNQSLEFGLISANGYPSKFSHANEKAEPGYYSVKLDDDNILAEVTTTTRVGMHRYTFSSSNASVILDLNWRDFTGSADVKQVSSKRLEGFRISSSWAKNQVVYFAAEFSKPFSFNPDFLQLLNNLPNKGNASTPNQTRRVALGFSNLRMGEQILVKVALSSVSIEGARKNLQAELPGWDFDKVRASAKAAWNRELSKIEVSGGTDAQTKTFYTALYHMMIHPSIFNDVDGQYKGHDGRIHQLPYRRDAETQRGKDEKKNNLNNSASQRLSGERSEQYTVFSLWDTFRAAHPLYTIIDQKRTVDFINSFIRMYEQGGRLPVWELWGEETDTMIGYHAVSVIADAMAKGIKGFDYEKAYEAAKHSAELDRDGLAAYKKRGYISMEDENESVSKTLEYAYDDWCIAQMARALGGETYKSDYGKYMTRAQNFENLFDSETGFMRPRVNGGFVKPFAPSDVTFNYTEGNAWQYTFFVPHDITRLNQLMGGTEKFAEKLDELLNTSDKLTGREQPDITGLIGQYAHGNEPSHHIAYLYNFADQKWKTQRYVRQILDKFYKPTPDGLIGNEDCGQMSAWYVLSASGFYPMTPGHPSYTPGAPLFPEIKYNLENGKIFTIKSPRTSSADTYLRVARFNGIPTGPDYIGHDRIMNGGLLEFEAVTIPAKTTFYPMFGMPREFVAVPIIEGGGRVFKDQTTITIRTTTPNSTILYAINGTNTTIYKEPFTIDRTSRVTAIAGTDRPDAPLSLIAEATFIKKPNDWTVKINSKYNRQYTGGGDEGLIDGIRGSVNFASGEWQGYQGQDFVATVDLQKETEIKKVGGGFLQVARSWIWMPTHVEFETSSDGVNFTRVADIKTDIDPTDMESKIRDYVQTISPAKARYVRVHAYNLGKIPAWHPGAGSDAFIFVDEIFINNAF